MVACFQLLPDMSFERLTKNKRILHFAAESALQSTLRPDAASYVTADFLNTSFDIKLDMCRMEPFWDNSLDTLIACDVLEHVPDDELAMKEIRRILKPGGMAILTVPQPDGWTTKLEMPPDATPEERLEKVGQEDHQRLYGQDFPEMLRETGFDVREVTQADFDPEIVERQVLHPPILSDRPLATNHRTIYFASKPKH